LCWIFAVVKVIGSDDDDDGDGDAFCNVGLLDIVDDGKGFYHIFIFGSHSMDVKLLSNDIPVVILLDVFFLLCDFRMSIWFNSRKKVYSLWVKVIKLGNVVF
jgi:hypothetical protein